VQHGGCRYPADQVSPIYRLKSMIRKTYCHMPYSVGSCFPAQEGPGAATCSVTLCGPQTSRMKKWLAGLPMRLGSRVFKACSHVTEALDT
jgi:hypothetical protein